jgi:hypothetical protein
MGHKYAGPPVELRDIARALPAIPQPLLWRISLYPRPQNTTTLSPAVELVYVASNGSTVVFKRWGGGGRATSTREVLGALLLAAQQAHLYCAGASPEDLMRRVLWDLGVPIS